MSVCIIQAHDRDISLSDGVIDGTLRWHDSISQRGKVVMTLFAPGVEVVVYEDTPGDAAEAIFKHLRKVADEVELHWRNINRAAADLPPLERKR